MNGFSRKSRSVLALRAGAAGLLALTAAGCADLRRSVSLPPVNPESPVAGVVGPASRLSYDVPRLSDVPPLPKNVPDAGTVKLGVVSMIRCRGGLERFPLIHPPLTGGTAQFAANARDVVQENPADVPSADSAARSDQFAAGLRAEVAPPAALASGAPLSADQSRPPSAPSAAPHSAPKPGRRAPPPRPAPAAAPSPPVQAAAAPAAPAAPAQVVQSNAAPPGLPAPLPDPLLARCT